MRGKTYSPPSPWKGVQQFIDTEWKPNHPLGWGYTEFVYLVGRGVNVTDISRAFNFDTPRPAKNALDAYQKEQDAKSTESQHTPATAAA